MGRDLDVRPPHPPARFAACFRDWPRQARLLADVASGRGLVVELCERWARVAGLSRQASTPKRLLAALVSHRLLTQTVRSLALGGGGQSRASLSLVTLTASGRACAEACGWAPQLTEWERLVCWHEAEHYPAHAMAVLLLTREARWRGMEVNICPTETNGGPDVWIAGAGFVEVERGRGSSAKWEANARLNEGRVLLCTLNPVRRRTLTRDVRLLGLPGQATDVRTLLYHRRRPTLWLENWWLAD